MVPVKKIGSFLLQFVAVDHIFKLVQDEKSRTALGNFFLTIQRRIRGEEDMRWFNALVEVDTENMLLQRFLALNEEILREVDGEAQSNRMHQALKRQHQRCQGEANPKAAFKYFLERAFESREMLDQTVAFIEQTKTKSHSNRIIQTFGHVRSWCGTTASSLAEVIKRRIRK